MDMVRSMSLVGETRRHHGVEIRAGHLACICSHGSLCNVPHTHTHCGHRVIICEYHCISLGRCQTDTVNTRISRIFADFCEPESPSSREYKNKISRNSLAEMLAELG